MAVCWVLHLYCPSGLGVAVRLLPRASLARDGDTGPAVLRAPRAPGPGSPWRAARGRPSCPARIRVLAGQARASFAAASTRGAACPTLPGRSWARPSRCGLWHLGRTRSPLTRGSDLRAGRRAAEACPTRQCRLAREPREPARPSGRGGTKLPQMPPPRVPGAAAVRSPLRAWGQRPRLALGWRSHRSP